MTTLSKKHRELIVATNKLLNMKSTVFDFSDTYINLLFEDTLEEVLSIRLEAEIVFSETLMETLEENGIGVFRYKYNCILYLLESGDAFGVVYGSNIKYLAPYTDLVEKAIIEY